MLEGDFSGEILDRYGFSGPHSMWEKMFEDRQLAETIISEMFSRYAGIIDSRIGIDHPLKETIDAHRHGELGFRCELVEPADARYEEMSIPYIDIVVDEGKPRPKVLINFEEFNNLLNGTPEVVAAIMQFLYLNYRLTTDQAIVYPLSDGSYDFDITTIWGMNTILATTLIALNTDEARYSIYAKNSLSREQRSDYTRVLDDARSVWQVPTYGPFVLN